MPSLLEYVAGLGELGATLGSGVVSGLVGAPYGVYKGVTSGKYGTPEGVDIAQQAATDFMARNTYQPRGQVAQDALQGLLGMVSDSKLPPVIPEAMALGSIPKQAYAAQGERIGMAAEKAIDPIVQRTMNSGGLPAQLMQDLTQGTRSQMVVGRGVTPEMTARANQMVNSGASEGRILQETGLVKVPTGSGNTWGRQISDKGIQIDFEKLASAPYDKSFFNRKPLLLGDVVSHPELYDVYPELKNIGLVKTSDGNAFYRNNLDGGEIGLSSTEYHSPEFMQKFQNDRRGMALHELQHAVQDIEGWPRGGNSEEFMGNAYKRVKEQADWGMKSLEDATTSFLERRGLTAPKDFKSFAQSVEYIRKNGAEYLSDVGPESRKRIEAVLSSDQGDKLIDAFNRFQDSYKKIDELRRNAGRKYMRLAGEGQSNAVESQYTSGDFSNKNPVTGYYRHSPDEMIYKYRNN